MEGKGVKKKKKIHLRNDVSRQLLHNITEIFLPKKLLNKEIY